MRPEWIDYNGHMTDSRYLQVFGDATDAVFRYAGIDDAYRKSGRAMYTVETHVTLPAEARALERLYVSIRVLEVDEKRVRLFHSLHRRRDDAVAATAEQLYLHVDTRPRQGRAHGCRGARAPRVQPGCQSQAPSGADAGAMPKIVDHEQRRDEIALVACRVVAQYGFDQATIVRIAREAGYTTGMVAHYFDTKQDIVIAALRLILRRIEERLTRGGAAEQPDLLAVLTEALPVDETRYIECAFWIAFWGQVPADRRLKRINAWLHREYLRLFERCLARGWREWGEWPPALREQVLRSVVTFINGVTASTVASRGDWPAARQIGQLRLQLELLHAWASSAAQPLRHQAAAPGVRLRSLAWTLRLPKNSS